MFGDGVGAETVTRVRPTLTPDRYGNLLKDATGDNVVLPVAGLAPGAQNIDHDHGREGVPVDWTVYFHVIPDVEPTDRLIIRGEEFEVNAEPQHWRSPYTELEVYVIEAHRAEG